MITIIPALEFMRSLCGEYTSTDKSAELRVWSCSYGVAFDLRAEKKTELVGLVGAFKNSIECYAQIGLPNVVRLLGESVSDSGIRFTADDLPLSLHLSREADLLRFTMSYHGQEKFSCTLQATMPFH